MVVGVSVVVVTTIGVNVVDGVGVVVDIGGSGVCVGVVDDGVDGVGGVGGVVELGGSTGG